MDQANQIACLRFVIDDTLRPVGEGVIVGDDIACDSCNQINALEEFVIIVMPRLYVLSSSMRTNATPWISCFKEPPSRLSVIGLAGNSCYIPQSFHP